MAYLSWISDENLTAAVKHCHGIWVSADNRSSLADVTRNVIDPFSLLFESKFSGVEINEWIEQEFTRQAQKSFTNSLGEFHQKVLGGANGWEDLGIGHHSKMDVRNTDRTIYAEVKNKYNTVSGSGIPAQHAKMMQFASDNPKVTVYFVNIIPKARPLDKVWVRKGNQNVNLRKISGDKFYELVSGDPYALRDLFHVLPKVIDTVCMVNTSAATNSTAIEELKEKLRSSQNFSSYSEYLFGKAFRSQIS